MENSKSEIIAWFNQVLKSQYNKIEQLGNGVAYCKLLNIIDPQNLNVTKIIQKPKTQIDHINNLKLVQIAMQKLHIKKQFDIDKVSKGSFHDNYDLALFFKKQYTIHFQGQNKENNTNNLNNTSLNNTSINNSLNINENSNQSDFSFIRKPESVQLEQLQIISKIIVQQYPAEQKIQQICDLLKVYPPTTPTQQIFRTESQTNMFSMYGNNNNNNNINNNNLLIEPSIIFKTDSKRQIQIQEQEQRAEMLCETPEQEEMLLDTNEQNSQKLSSSKIIMKMQSMQKEQIKRETPNFFGSPPQNNLAEFIRSESKQQQQYVQQYSIQKQMQLQNQITSNEYQSPFRDHTNQKEPYSQSQPVFYSCGEKAILEE